MPAQRWLLVASVMLASAALRATPPARAVADPDVSLLAPFTPGMGFTVSGAHYGGKGGYFNTRACQVGTAPDHCQNQLFGLDLVPDNQDDAAILAPAGGTIEFLPSDPDTFGCIGMTLDDGMHLNICHLVDGSWTAHHHQ